MYIREPIQRSQWRQSRRYFRRNDEKQKTAREQRQKLKGSVAQKKEIWKLQQWDFSRHLGEGVPMVRAVPCGMHKSHA
ncbi:hypothetical protein V6N13_032833 [Hibiscus sabdariffa]